MINRVYPISYSIPKEIFIKKEEIDKIISEKVYDFAPLVPGLPKTYIYTEEEEYYKMYRQSKYAKTCKIGGWDCMMHYEMLANGCIPLFKKLAKCPPWTLQNFPKKQIIDLVGINDLTDLEYKEKLNSLIDYGINHLTCTHSAKYVLSTIFPGQADAQILKKRILLLSCGGGHRSVNFTRELLSIGMRRLLGECFVDHPKINILYKGCANKKKYTGNGFTYSDRLDDIFIHRENIRERILANEFDVIIYGKVGNKDGHIDSLWNLPYWDVVSMTYSADNIIFLYGGDLSRNIHTDKDLLMHINHGICFVREGFE